MAYKVMIVPNIIRDLPIVKYSEIGRYSEAKIITPVINNEVDRYSSVVDFIFAPSN